MEGIMMYQEKLIACVKVSGKVLKERGDQVFLPFGSEYSILIKNLNSLKAKVKIFIDGTDVFDGSQLVVDGTSGNNSMEIFRFVKNGNMNEGNCFKFIERTSDIEEFRGVQAEDGIVRVEFQFAPASAPYVVPAWQNPWYQPPLYPNNPSPLMKRHFSTQPVINTAGTEASNINNAALYSAEPVRCAASPMQDSQISTFASNAGITVPGSISNQQFQTTGDFITDGVTHVMVFRLFGGNNEGVKIVEPVTKKTRLICETCGKANSPDSRFCSRCGTSLVIV